MTHDNLRQSRTSTEDQQRKTVSVLTRRDLLKHAAVASGISVTGVGSNGIVSAAEADERSASPRDTSETLDTNAGQPLDKMLAVRGVGDGTNIYQFSITDAVTAETVIEAQVRDNDEPLVTGEVQKGCVDEYLFAGEVTDVSTRGSITYYIHK